MEKYLHLDSEYRCHWQDYYLADGRVFDSRYVNWRQVEWEKVVSISTHIKGKTHKVDCKQPNFLFFLCFRWGGITWEASIKVPIHLWTVGYSDGTNAFLIDIEFHSGDVVKKYVLPLSAIKRHIHPRVQRNSLCLQL